MRAGRRSGFRNSCIHTLAGMALHVLSIVRYNEAH